MNAVEIKNVSKHYKGFTLSNITMNIPTGSIVGLIGENGAGKSTLIKLITGIAHCDSGSISVLGTDNRTPEFTETKQDMGIVLDYPCFPDRFTAKDINRIMKAMYKNWNEEHFFSFTKNFDKSMKYKNYSKGMRAVLRIAAAMSHNARLLIMDEPTSGLDPVVRDEILDIISHTTIDERNSVLISSHILNDLEKICDYIAYIHNGKLKFFEEKDSLCEKLVVVNCIETDLCEIPSAAVIGIRKSDYGIEALIERAAVIDGMRFRKSTIEDIMVYTARGEQQWKKYETRDFA